MLTFTQTFWCKEEIVELGGIIGIDQNPTAK